MDNYMLIIDNVRYSRPDAYKAGLVDKDGNLLTTKQVSSSVAVRKDTGEETAAADKLELSDSEEDED